MQSMRRIVIVGLQPVQILDVSGPLEVFSNAPGYAVQLGSPGTDGNLQTSRGIALSGAVPIGEIKGPIDTLVIAGGLGAETGLYDENFVAWIAEASTRSRRVASICTGAFVLGAAGLIDGKKVVTHWKFCDELARKFPLASVQPDPIYLKDGAIYTSAGITAGIDLCLALLEEDLGHEAALHVARFLVMFLVRPGGQAQYSHMLLVRP
jgi:transcriptional regulator GlxA family with amidase domain